MLHLYNLKVSQSDGIDLLANPNETKWTGKWALANQQKPDPHNTNCIPVFSLNNHHLVVIPIFAVVVDKPKKTSPTVDATSVG